jgi:glycosyltransferase involved in cell wall biosynthesis
MRVAVFHNRYVFRGGEEAVVDLEVDLLRKAGHEVHLFTTDSRDVRSLRTRLRAGFSARWNAEIARRVAAFLARHPVELGHVHNFFPLLSPAVHATLRRLGLPVVQTLHNYRLVCANGLLLRDGRPCEDCVSRGPWNAVRHGCYRGSRLQTAVWAEATLYQRRRGLWHELVDRFVVPSEFACSKLVAAGLPGERCVVKPNPVADPGEPRFGGRGALYVGRLSPEKGLRLLLDAWRELDGYPLTIVGTGPDEAALQRLAGEIPGVRLTGELSGDAVRAELARAAFVVAPSIWYENFPLAVAEALAAGRPVVASHPTALSDMIDATRTALLFPLGDPRALAAACRRLAADPARTEAMGREARLHYESFLTPERSLERLVRLYRDVLGERR